MEGIQEKLIEDEERAQPKAVRADDVRRAHALIRGFGIAAGDRGEREAAGAYADAASIIAQHTGVYSSREEVMSARD